MYGYVSVHVPTALCYNLKILIDTVTNGLAKRKHYTDSGDCSAESNVKMCSRDHAQASSGTAQSLYVPDYAEVTVSLLISVGSRSRDMRLGSIKDT